MLAILTPLVFALLLSEALSLFLLVVVYEDSFSLSSSRRALRQVATHGAVSFQAPEPIESIHPYVGFVLNRDSSDAAWVQAGWSRPAVINTFGLEGIEPLQTRKAGRVLIHVFGGSVAKALATAQRLALERAWRQYLPSHAEPLIVATALGGFKQPQQLHLLTYLLSLGGHFDVIINLDGFNEVALHESENAPRNVHASYPRNWFGRTQLHSDREFRACIDRALVRQRHRAALALAFSRRGAFTLFTARLAWRFWDRRLERRAEQAISEVARFVPVRTPFIAAGPLQEPAPPEICYEELADIWYRSSLQMHALCRANGIKYFHFLQPNQYVLGSKVLHGDEIATAFDPRHPYRRGVELGYPILRERGRRLRQQQVAFGDLSQIFAAVRAPVYEDTCCHLNVLGNELLADAIVRRIGGSADVTDHDDYCTTGG